MIEIEQNSQKYCEWNGDEDISDTDVPKINKPSSVYGRRERFTGGQHAQTYIRHLADMNEASEENYCQRCAVVLDEHSNIMLEQFARADNPAHVPNYKYQDWDHDGEVEVWTGALSSQNLDAFLQVYECNIETEDVAGKAGNIFNGITSVSDGEEPVHG